MSEANVDDIDTRQTTDIHTQRNVDRTAGLDVAESVTQTIVLPEHKAHESYSDIFLRYKQLYPALKDVDAFVSK